MINELFQVANAMDKFQISSDSWHRKYKTIPKVSDRAPCFRIVLDHGKICDIESVPPERAAKIRKYGSNQGSFPAMNIAPLFKVAADQAELVDPKNASKIDLDSLPALCGRDNWSKNTQARYRNCVLNVPEEIHKLFEQADISCPVFETILDEFADLTDGSNLQKELASYALQMLASKKDVSLALQLLFQPEDEKDKKEDKTVNLSVVFDSTNLIDSGCAVISDSFTQQFNRALVQADNSAKSADPASELDAFGIPFSPLEEPMPNVKLAAGFDVSLRTMFHGQPCQTRYGKIENATYPISPEMRTKLQTALDWIATPAHEDVTWTRTGKGEVLFAYPESMPEQRIASVSVFIRNRNTDKSQTFEKSAAAFIDEIKHAKPDGTDSRAERIQILMLRKLDKARSKAVYSYNTTPKEIETQAEQWSIGCHNLPRFPFGAPFTVFPLDCAGILNKFWKQDGTLATDKIHPTPSYRGMELFFQPQEPFSKDLAVLVRNAANLAPGLQGDYFRNEKTIASVRPMLALMGLLLHRKSIQKENYMNELPYLLGQLLKLSDALHEMYCKVMRNGDIPPQLAGSGMYIFASEQPVRALAQLSLRISPYLTWARTYRVKNISDEGKESWRAGWYLAQYEQISNTLHENWTTKTRFTDEEKAQLFIGYLASFPKKEQKTTENNDGGNTNE